MKRTTMIAALVSVALLFGGCSRLAKEGIGVASGAKGVYAEIQAPSRPLGMYHNIQPGQIEDSFGGRTPPGLLSALPGKITEQLHNEGLPTGTSGKTLVITGKVIYYEAAGITGEVFGPFEEAVAEIQLVDKDTGRVVSVANCVGRSTTSLNRGVDKKAEGLAKGIVKWISKHYPEAGRVRPQD
ncbi:MAG: hypothetical protein SVT52_01750 [Planctomycetota bacterium]|nr:hypothetical protein [Planctomycetota bacterium]